MCALPCVHNHDAYGPSFLITAATVAAKGLSDSFWNNATYARVGGVKLAELGLLELEFLYRVDWRIVPNPEVLVDYYRGLVERSDGYVLEGDDRLNVTNLMIGENEDDEEREEEEEEEEEGEEEGPDGRQDRKIASSQEPQPSNAISISASNAENMLTMQR